MLQYPDLNSVRLPITLIEAFRGFTQLTAKLEVIPSTLTVSHPSKLSRIHNLLSHNLIPHYTISAVKTELLNNLRIKY
jgi:hypothetical protein